jgi:hypothetical protein
LELSHLTFAWRQIYTSSAAKAMHSAAKKSPALRVVFFASALSTSPTRKFFASIKGQITDFSMAFEVKYFLNP